MNTQERMIEKRTFRIVVIAVAAAAVLVIAALTGAASAASLQAGDMIPDANTFAAVAARSATADDTPQVGDMIPDASTIAAFAAQSTTAESASNAGTQWQILQRQAYGLASGSQTAQSGLATAQSQTWENNASNAQAQWQIAQRQAYGLAQESQTAQLVPLHPDEQVLDMQVMMQALRTTQAALNAGLATSHYDEEAAAMQLMAQSLALRTPQGGQAAQLAPSQLSIEAAQVAAAMQATPVQSTQTAQLAPSRYDDYVDARQVAILQSMRTAQGAQTAQLAPSHYDDSIEAPQVAAAMRAMAAIHVPSMEARRLALASAKAAAQEKSQEARLQDPTLATPAQSAQTAQLASSQYDSPGGLVTSAQATELGLPALAAAKEMAPQGAQTAQLAPSHYDSLGALTSAQARALGLLALAGVKEMAEERYLTAILQHPALLALVQAEEASQSQHVGLTVGELASAESQHEATESPVEAAFETAEAAHNPGVSMLAPSHYGSLGTVTSAQARALGLPALAGMKEVAEQKSQLARLQDPTLATPATQASQDGQTVGGPVVLPTAANSEQEDEAAESPAEVAFEEAEVAQAAGLSMSRFHSQGPVTAIQAWALTLPALTVNACSNSLAIACTANGTRPALAVR